MDYAFELIFLFITTLRDYLTRLALLLVLLGSLILIFGFNNIYNQRIKTDDLRIYSLFNRPSKHAQSKV